MNELHAFKRSQIVKFKRQSGEIGDRLYIPKGTTATVTDVDDDWITLEHFRDDDGEEVLAIAQDGESYTGDLFFQDFEALEIVYPIPD